MASLPLCGYLIDVHGNRFIFIWLLVSFAIALVMLWILFQDWKKLGGDESYVPPSPPPDSDRAFEVLPAGD